MDGDFSSSYTWRRDLRPLKLRTATDRAILNRSWAFTSIVGEALSTEPLRSRARLSYEPPAEADMLWILTDGMGSEGGLTENGYERLP